MKKYKYEDVEYNSLWDVRQKLPHVSFPVEPTEGQLAELGIKVVTVKPPKPTQEELDERRRFEILRELDEIDRRLVRPLAAIVAGTADKDDRERFEELMTEKDRLRNELEALEWAVRDSRPDYLK